MKTEILSLLRLLKGCAYFLNINNTEAMDFLDKRNENSALKSKFWIIRVIGLAFFE